MSGQEDDPKGPQTRRKFLEGMMVAGAAGVVAIIPEKWTKPVLDAVVTPAHADHSFLHTQIQNATSTTPAPTTTPPSATTTTTTPS